MNSSAASVLVVDDDPALRMLSRIVLEIEGFEVREAASVAQAEAAIAERRPDVVTLDVHLGLEASDELFARLRAQGIPVAAVTGTAEISEYTDRADATLTKPFDPAALVEIVKRLAKVEA